VNGTASGAGQRLAGWLIGRACRRLPAQDREDRYREWTAEADAILRGPGALRPVRALRYAAGTTAGARRLGQPGPASPARRLLTGIGVYLAVVAAFAVLQGESGPHQRFWPFLLLVSGAVCFAGYCLNDLRRARGVRFVPKWVWVIALVTQIPLGGIVYLSVGRDRSAGRAG
jgi:hypothetical protein